MKTLQKTAACLLLLLTLTLNRADLYAQEEKSRALLGDGSDIGRKDLGFMAAASLGTTRMDGAHAALFNLRGGLTVKDRFTVGAYYNGSVNDIMPKSETTPGLYMDFRSVGGFVEYTAMSKRLVHLSFPLFLGYGEVEMDSDSGPTRLGEAEFFTVEPAALLEVNVFRHVRLNLGAGYRFVGRMDYRNLTQGEISGFSGYLGLKIGSFR